MTSTRDPSDETSLRRCGGEAATHCHDDDLPADPFVALRVSYGMLLGEDDFRVLMGNPRGKHMLHASWLHGSGVVWGYDVSVSAEGTAPRTLKVGPGLAVDARGREVRLETSHCLDLDAWVTAWTTTLTVSADGGPARAWVLAEFDSCLDRPVPALADPCDVSRRHDDYSRVVETVKIVVTTEEPRPTQSMRRLRILLGLQDANPNDDVDKEALTAICEVRKALPHDRAAVLLEWFQTLAARDVTGLRPHGETGQDCLPQFPVAEDAAGVMLAEISFEVTGEGSCPTAGPVTVNPDVRQALLSTAILQDLLCGLAPGLIERHYAPDAGGPRLDPKDVTWNEDRTTVTLVLDRDVAPGSWEGALHVTSLSDTGQGWHSEHIDEIRQGKNLKTIVVTLDESPRGETVRLVIRGTGQTPLYGRQPRAPFAGLQGGPPGTEYDGHDAAVTTQFSTVMSAGGDDHEQADMDETTTDEGSVE